MKCPNCNEEISTTGVHTCHSLFSQYYWVIRDLTPAEICQHYDKIVKEKDEEIERLQSENEILKSENIYHNDVVKLKAILNRCADYFKLNEHNLPYATRGHCFECNLILDIAELGKKEEDGMSRL